VGSRWAPIAIVAARRIPRSASGGAFNGSGALSDTVTGYVPLRGADVGARLARSFYVGALVQLGAIVPSACSAGMQCSGTNTRVGVLGAFHFLPTSLLDPWNGAGFGYEIESVSRSIGSTHLDLTARGLELVDVEIGVDLRPSAHIRLGPVVSTSVGRYTSVTLNGTTTHDFDAVLHGWGMLGIRGAYDL
jgi:hypothetical protein